MDPEGALPSSCLLADPKIILIISIYNIYFVEQHDLYNSQSYINAFNTKLLFFVSFRNSKLNHSCYKSSSFHERHMILFVCIHLRVFELVLQRLFEYRMKNSSIFIQFAINYRVSQRISIRLE